MNESEKKINQAAEEAAREAERIAAEQECEDCAGTAQEGIIIIGIRC